MAFRGRTWLVHTYDPRILRVAQLVAEDGTPLEVSYTQDKTDPTFVVLANPSADWPFQTLPEKPRWGKIMQVGLIQDGALVPLVPFLQWIVAEPLRSGGSLFLAPTLNLKAGDVLQVQHEKGTRNVTISPSFGTVQHRQKMAATVKVPKRPQTGYDRLLQNEGDFDE